MAPLCVKLLKPNPAGFWQFVPAMTQGADALCGPRILPGIGPAKVKVSGVAALATPAHANVVANAIPAKPKLLLRLRIMHTSRFVRALIKPSPISRFKIHHVSTIVIVVAAYKYQ